MESDRSDEEAGPSSAKEPSTRSEHGSGGGHGPPETGERGDPQRDPESGVPRDPVESEPGDIEPEDDPTLGKDTHGG